MSDLVVGSPDAQIEPHFPRSHDVPQVDDRRVISGIIFVIRNGLRMTGWLKISRHISSCNGDLDRPSSDSG